MKKLLLISIAIILVVSCRDMPSKPKNGKEIIEKFSNSSNINVGVRNYVVKIPNGWTTKDMVHEGVKFHYLYPPLSDSTQWVSVNVINESMRSQSMDDYMEKMEQTMQNDIPRFKALGKGSFSTSAINGKWLYYSMNPEEIDAECVAYIIPSDDIAYIITAGTPKGEMHKYRSTFDKIAQSFKFKD